MFEDGLTIEGGTAKVLQASRKPTVGEGYNDA